MQLDDFIRTLVKRWYVTLGLLAVAILGAYLYTYMAGTNTAAATVGVPFSALTQWDSVVHGRALAERVSEQIDDGSTIDEVKGQYAGSFKTGTGRLTPVYEIRASDDAPDRALLIADTVVAEALKLYTENREANLDYVLAAYREQIDQAEAEAGKTRSELNTFLIENNAYSLPSRIADQSALVSSLRQQSEYVDASGIGEPPEESAELQVAKAELTRLLELEPEYADLELDVSLSQAAISRLEAEAAALEVSGPGYESTLEAVNEQLETERAELVNAQSELDLFLSANGIEDLPAATRTQQMLVNQLLLADVAAAGNTATVQGALAAAEATLLELQSILPEFNRLTREIVDAETLVGVREQQQLFLAQIPPTTDRIEMLDRAAMVSSTWWTMIRYAIAVMLAIFLSLGAVYILTFFEKVPVTSQQLEEEFGVQVLARIPRSS